MLKEIAEPIVQMKNCATELEKGYQFSLIATTFRLWITINKIGLSQNEMPYTSVMIHFIWATKNRQPIIQASLKPILLTHIKANSKLKNIYIDTLNCVEDHIHLLISLGTEQTISKVAMLIKGESSFWVNQQKLIDKKFEWQDEYIALSVSKSAIDRVRKYISNQEEHHKKQTFTQEYDSFLTLHGFNKESFG